MKAKNLLDMVWRSVQRYPDKAAFMWKSEGRYQSLTYRQYWKEVRHVAAGLSRLGIGRDDKVAILSENDPRWPITDLAICSLGAATVPIYPTLPTDQISHILQNADCRVAVVQNEQQLDKVIHGSAVVDHIVVMHSKTTVSLTGKVLPFFRLAKKGAEHPLENWEQIWGAIEREHLATIIYTSGTTGQPKGAMLTHGNFLANIEGVQFWCMEARHDDVFLSYLPLSHVFERMAGQFMPMSVGATVAYAENIDTIPENLLEVKPTVMTSVPLLFEKVYARVQEQIQSGTPIRRKIFDWAVRVGLQRYEYYLHSPMDKLMLGEMPSRLRRQLKLADRLVYRKVRARLGGRLRGMISGGAALNPEIARFFWAIDVPVLEGYGMTETSPVIAANPIARTKIGTVGRPLPNLEVCIAADGEVLVRGPSVMKGYYKNEEATAAQIRDGWLHTGDLGQIDEEGYLRIVDRKKRILVLSTGKNVAPQPVEDAITQSIFVQQCALIGHQRKYVIALVVPDFENLISWVRKKGISSELKHVLVRHPEVQSLVRSEVERLTQSFAPFEQPKKVVILDKLWTIETGELTPTLKVRIHEIERKYNGIIDLTYSEDAFTGDEWLGGSEIAAGLAIRTSGEGKV
ncbi:AMP-dependent synthetase/ligase [Effusibacillus consociatus]|uniref:AMP-dependent synthetase/ligase n=1 Tax=Effusibacillus consociatus TaxID=1117041 RepID=A0ABV9Q187_9BACL